MEEPLHISAPASDPLQGRRRRRRNRRAGAAAAVADRSSRSLAWTLASAAFIYALLFTTSWSMGVRHGKYSSSTALITSQRLLWHGFATFVTPFETMEYMVNQAMVLQLVRGSYVLTSGEPPSWHSGVEASISHLILSSTLYVEVPPSQDPGPHLRRYLVGSKSLTTALRSQSVQHLFVVWPLIRRYHVPKTMQSQYLRLPAPKFWDEKSLHEREALLMRGFMQLYESADLHAMDERAGLTIVRVVAVVLCAGRYALGVAERWRRGLGVSPVEAMLCMFSVPMLMQVLMEPSAARLNHDRPLLLRQEPRHFTRYRDLERPRSIQYEISALPSEVQLLTYLASLSCSYLLLPILSLYLTFYYRLSNYGRLCSLPFLLLFSLSTIPLFSPRHLLSTTRICNLLFGHLHLQASLIHDLWQMVMLFLTITLVLWSTIQHWDSFCMPNTARPFAQFFSHLVA